MSEIELKLTANVDDATRGVSGFRKEFADLVRTVEKPLRQINTFRELESSLERTGRQLTTARDNVRALGDQMASTAIPTKQLQVEYRDATNQLKLLERQEASQGTQLAKMRRELQAAGTDTRNLAGEQKRLQSKLGQRLSTGQNDKSVQDARASLAIAKYSDTAAQISKMQQQFQLLRSTGKLTATEMAIGQNTLRQSLAESANQTRVLTGATEAWKGGLSDVRAEILAGAVAFTGFAMAAGDSFGKFASFQQQVASIATITDLSSTQLKDLSEGIRGLSRDMGKSSTESAAAVYDLLGSGVATADVMKVLALSTKAAVAGMSETKTAAGVGVSIINAYGESMDNLGNRYDQLFLAIKDGVVTFDQLSAGLGQVLPTAAAAGVSFSEVGSAIARMTVQGIQAPQAITGLTSAINQLAAPAPEAAKAMAALGIQWKGLTGTIEQISKKNIGFDAMRQIIPDTEGRTAVLALSKAYAEFAAQVERMDHASGATERAYNIMKDTPEAQVKKFKAAVEDLQNSFGAAVAAGLPVVNLLTDLLNAFNSLPEPIRNGIVSTIALGVAAGTLSLAIKAVAVAFTLFGSGLVKVAADSAVAGAAIDGVSTKAGKLGGILGSLGGAVRTGGLLIIAGQLAELYGLYKQMEELEQSQKDQAKTLNDLIKTNAAYKDTLVSTSAEVGKMTDSERKDYTQRLQNAQTYYSKLSEQISRANTAKNGGTGPVPQEAIDAFKKSREYGQALEQESAFEAARLEDSKSFTAAMKSDQESLLANAETALAARSAAEKSAGAELEKAKAAQLETQKRYSKALAELDSGSGSDASYGAAQALKVGARQALKAGDIEGAKQKAKSALEVLQKLADAGENTYGFAGFMKELQSIEQAADGEITKRADDKHKALEDQVASLKADMDALKSFVITPTLSPEGVAEVTQQMHALKAKLELEMFIPLVLTPTAEQKTISGQVVDNSAVKFPTATAPSVPTAAVRNEVTDPLPVAQTKSALKYQAGVSSYSQNSTPEFRVPVDPVVSDASMDKLKQQITEAAGLKATVEPVLPEALPDLQVPVAPAIDQAAIDLANSQAAIFVEQLKRQMVIPVLFQTGATSSGADLALPLPGFAAGDMVRGPGTGTSDSILARLSNGEFIMKAAAVQHYGPDLLRQINERRLPRFAEGGAVGDRFFPSVPAPSQSLLQQISPSIPEPMGHVSMNVGGETYHLQAPQQDFERLIRNQRIKFGKS